MLRAQSNADSLSLGGIQAAGPIGRFIMSRTISDSTLKRQYLLDRLFRGATLMFAFLVLALLAGIIATLLIGAWPSIKTFGLGFFISSEWNPVTQKFGALVPIVGTLVTSAIALLIGIPVSFGIALFITELSPRWLKRPLGIAIELLAGIPSII
jgi:phosphate transport system permease protein